MVELDMPKHGGAFTRNERAGAAVAAMAGSLLAMAPAFGQGSGKVTVEVSKCLGLKSPDERLACFEAQVVASGRTADAEPATAPAEARPAETRQADGVQPSQPATSRADVRHEQTTQEFAGTVTALRETVPNNWVITLDNDQVWRQTQPEWYPLKPGQRVRISSTRWGGAFRLSVEELHGFITVERVR
jgi:hypothetical protein